MFPVGWRERWPLGVRLGSEGSGSGVAMTTLWQTHEQNEVLSNFVHGSQDLRRGEEGRGRGEGERESERKTFLLETG